MAIIKKLYAHSRNVRMYVSLVERVICVLDIKAMEKIFGRSSEPLEGRKCPTH